MSIRAISSVRHRGNQPAQEDFILGEAERGVFALADGFGGPEPGAMASQTASQAVREFLIKKAGDHEATLPFVLRTYFSLAGNVLFNALVHANRKLLQLNKDKGVHEKGGASLIAGFLDADLLALASVGSCEAWLLRGVEAARLVAPRAYGKLLDPFAEEKASDHRFPLMALGISEDLEPDIWEYRIRSGDWLVLSTGAIGGFIQKELLRKKQEELTLKQLQAGFPAWVEQMLESEEPRANFSAVMVIF